MAYLGLVLALFLLFSLGFFSRAPLVFPLWVLLISVHILLANLGRSQDEDSTQASPSRAMEVPTMNIRLDVEVNCIDGLAGHCAAVVLNPVSRVISHIVVQPAGHGHAQVLVPLDYITDGSVQQIGLRCTLDELGKLDPFMQSEPIQQEAISETELAVRAGTPVHATDGHIGQVDRFFVRAGSGEIMQLVLLEKHLLSKKDFIIPVDQIDRIGEEAVHLKLSRQEVEQLPRV